MAIALTTKTSSKVRENGITQDIFVGDTVTVDTKIKEGDKERIQKFKGIVIRVRGRGADASFTVRHIGPGNMGVERTWPLISPSVTNIKVEKQGSVRRAKLYYLRSRTGKAANVVKSRATVAKTA